MEIPKSLQSGFITAKGRQPPKKEDKNKQSNSAKMGDLVHAALQSELAMRGMSSAAELPLIDSKNQLVSKIDAWSVDNEPIEIKTVSLAEITAMSSPRPEHIQQLKYYINTTKAKRGILFYTAREAPGVRKMFYINADGHEDEAVQYMKLKRDFAAHDPQSSLISSARIATEEFESNAIMSATYDQKIKEMKSFRRRIVMAKKKKEWDLTYKYARSGLDPSALNREGMSTGVASDLRHGLTQFGSPWKGGKKNKGKFEQSTKRAGSRPKGKKNRNLNKKKAKLVGKPFQSKKPKSKWMSPARKKWLADEAARRERKQAQGLLRHTETLAKDRFESGKSFKELVIYYREKKREEARARSLAQKGQRTSYNNRARVVREGLRATKEDFNIQFKQREEAAKLYADKQAEELERSIFEAKERELIIKERRLKMRQAIKSVTDKIDEQRTRRAINAFRRSTRRRFERRVEKHPLSPLDKLMTFEHRLRKQLLRGADPDGGNKDYYLRKRNELLEIMERDPKRATEILKQYLPEEDILSWSKKASAFAQDTIENTTNRVELAPGDPRTNLIDDFRHMGGSEPNLIKNVVKSDKDILAFGRRLLEPSEDEFMQIMGAGERNIQRHQAKVFTPSRKIGRTYRKKTFHQQRAPGAHQMFVDIESLYRSPLEANKLPTKIFEYSSATLRGGHAIADLPLNLQGAELATKMEALQREALSTLRTKRAGILDLNVAQKVLDASHVGDLVSQGIIKKGQISSLLAMSERAGYHDVMDFLHQDVKGYLHGVARKTDNGWELTKKYQDKFKGNAVHTNLGQFYEGQKELVQDFVSNLEDVQRQSQGKVVLSGHNVGPHDIPMLRRSAEIHGVPWIDEKNIVISDSLHGSGGTRYKQALGSSQDLGILPQVEKLETNAVRPKGPLALEVMGRSMGVVSEEGAKFAHTSAHDVLTNVVTAAVSEKGSNKVLQEAVFNYHQMSESARLGVAFEPPPISPAVQIVPNVVQELASGAAVGARAGQPIYTRPTVANPALNLKPTFPERAISFMDDIGKILPSARGVTEAAKTIFDGGIAQDLRALNKVALDFGRPLGLNKIRGGGMATIGLAAGLLSLSIVGIGAALDLGSLNPLPKKLSHEKVRNMPMISTSGDDEEHRFKTFTGRSAEEQRAHLTDFGSGYQGQVGSKLGIIMTNIMKGNKSMAMSMTAESGAFVPAMRRVESISQPLSIQRNIVSKPIRSDVEEIIFPRTKMNDHKIVREVKFSEQKRRHVRRIRFRATANESTESWFRMNQNRRRSYR